MILDETDVENFTFIDLFAGGGGLSLGLMNSGWQGLLAVEKDKYAFETLRANLVDDGDGAKYVWPDWFPCEPIAIAPFMETYRTQLQELKGKVTLLAGGPPCQGFSLAGKRKKCDPRNSLFKYYGEIVEILRPPFLLLENVRGIDVEFGKKSREAKKQTDEPSIPFSLEIKKKLEELNYEVYPQLLRASDFGVPQIRPRFFMIAVAKELLVNMEPCDPFTDIQQVRKEFLEEKKLPTDRAVSVKEAISDLQVAGKVLIDCVDSKGFKQIAYTYPETPYQKLLHGSMNGKAPNSLRLAKHREHIVERFQGILDTCRRGVQLNKEDRERLGLKKHCTVPLHPDRPSHTLTTLPDDLLHYSEPRILSVREYARLQTFPDWYTFKGKYTTGGHLRVNECPRYTQVGNAVPPFLAECLGVVLKRWAVKLLKRQSENNAQEQLLEECAA